MTDPEDRRWRNYWGLWVSHLKEEHPDWGNNPQDNPRVGPLSTFLAGWQARRDASFDMLTEDGRNEREMKIIQDEFNFLKREYSRAWAEYFETTRRSNNFERLYRRAQVMLSTAKLDESDAPLWKRISEQRRSLRALHKFVAVQDVQIKMLQRELEKERARGK